MGYATSLVILPGLLLGTLVASSTSGSDEQSFEVGSFVPAFECQDDQGKIWSSRDHIGKSIVVLYFYPSDFAFGCTRQARGYQDALGQLSGECAKVVGISGDTAEAHRLFKSELNLKFTLLSDAEGQIARRFGVPLRVGGKAMAAGTNSETTALPRKFTAARWTFIIGLDGRIIYRDTDVSPAKDSMMVLNYLLNKSIK